MVGIARRVVVALSLAAALLAAPAFADDKTDCDRGSPDARIKSCTVLITMGLLKGHDLASIFLNRGTAYGQTNRHDAALADFNRALQLWPDWWVAQSARGYVYSMKGQYDLAIADFGRVIQTQPREADAYLGRADAYRGKGQADLAIADFTKAIALKPDAVFAFAGRAAAYHSLKSYDLAIADLTRAIRLNPDVAAFFVRRGDAYREKSQTDLALADYGQAIRLAPTSETALASRASLYRAKGDHDRAIADYDAAIALKADFGTAFLGRGLSYEAKGDQANALADLVNAEKLLPADSPFRADAANRVAALRVAGADAARLAALQAAGAAPPPVAVAAAPAAVAAAPAAGPPPAAAPIPLGRRVALVVGNGAYTGVPALPNPTGDAGLVAASLKAVGFDVRVVNNAGRDDFLKALHAFQGQADGADWAVVYFAGHGIEMGGTNFLVPVDAKLAEDRDVPDETVSLDRVLAAVDGARGLKMVVLDACRNNPFVASMKRSGASSRAVGRGLALVEPAQATLVAYAAKAGSVASDGDAGNSPFAKAFAQRVGEPGVEIGKMFRLVRDDVLAATGQKQEPFVYGSLPGTDFFFKPPTVGQR
ncbi:MAG: tetratricopeptide repeat protein [Bauldia sp.]